MYKKSWLIMVGILIVIGLFGKITLAEEVVKIEDIYEISLTGLDYSTIESVGKADLQKYYSYLPFLTVNQDGNCQITMGGSLTNLIRNRNDEVQQYWEDQVLKEYDKRVQLIKIAAHLFSRAIYYKHEQELYQNFLEQAIPLYQQLEAQGFDAKKLAEFRVEIELKQYALSGKVKSLQELLLSLNQLIGKEISLNQIPDNYPEKIMQSFEIEYVNLLELERYRIGYSIEQMEMQLNSLKKNKYPNINVRYSCSFGPDYDELEHRLEINLSDFFNLTNYGKVDYNVSYKVNTDQTSEVIDKWETTYNDNAQLTLYPYPIYRAANTSLKDLEKEISKSKTQRESLELQKQQNIISEIDTISHFYTLYHINLGKQIMFQNIQQLSKDEQISTLIAQLAYQLEQEEYYFNFSYLYSFFKRNNQESGAILRLLSTD